MEDEVGLIDLTGRESSLSVFVLSFPYNWKFSRFAGFTAVDGLESASLYTLGVL